MEINENRICSNINRIEKNTISNKKTKVNIDDELKNSRNLLAKNKSEASLNFNINKNIILSFNKYQDIPNTNEGLYSSNNNYFSDCKNSLINYVKFDMNYIRNISTQRYNTKNNANDFCCRKLSENKRRKIDFIKYKFLLGQKNYFKRLFQNFDFGLSSYYSKWINPYLSINTK